MIKKTSLLICIILLLTILFSGCTNSRTATVDTVISVNESAFVTTYKTTISMPENTYHDFVNSLATQKYSSVREYLLRDYGGSSSYFTTTETIGGTTTIVLSNVIPVPSEKLPKSIHVKIQNNQVYFNDSSYSNNYFFQKNLVARLDYKVTLPIKVDRGNYQTQSKDGYTANWVFTNDQNSWVVNNPVDIPELYVVSQVANTENYRPDTTTSGLEGFIAIIGILAGAILICRKNN